MPRNCLRYLQTTFQYTGRVATPKLVPRNCLRYLQTTLQYTGRVATLKLVQRNSLRYLQTTLQYTGRVATPKLVQRNSLRYLQVTLMMGEGGLVSEFMRYCSLLGVIGFYFRLAILNLSWDNLFLLKQLLNNSSRWTKHLYFL